jgi:diguanylate cyclase (GGDEF)-like protein/PAS domain S-box-containing protein
MRLPVRQLLPLIAEWLVMVALVAAFGLFSKLFTRDELGVSSLWLANGLMLGYLLYARREHWVALLVACMLGQLASGALVRDPLQGVLLAATFNTMEVVAAAWPLRATIHNARELSRPRASLRFLLWAVLVAPLLSCLAIAALLTVSTGDTPPLSMLESWYAGHALGMATMAPVMLALRASELSRLFRRENMLEVVLVTLLIMAITTAVFWQSRYPLLFLIFPPVLLSALRGGFAGTAFAVIIVVIIAVTLTSFGHGPLMPISPDGRPGFSTYVVLQSFIGVLLLTSFPVAVAMSAWRRNQSTERKLRSRLKLIADHSSDVVVLTDLDGRRLYVSPSVTEVLGYQPEQFLRGTFRDLVGPAHIAALQQQISQVARKQSARATITFPGRHADGRRLWLEARMKHFRDADFMLFDNEQLKDVALNRGASGEEGFIVTLRDISRRHQIEQALETANRRLASLVWKDGLTGLGNRRQFDKALVQGWEQCQLIGMPLSVILLDVDYFKLFNDHYGHQEGDHCLTAVAGTLASNLRDEQDCAARYGGEEFAMILPQTSVEGASRIAERVRACIEKLAIPHAGSPLGQVTISLGVSSCLPLPDGRPEDLVSAADRALYAGKEAGRNRVTVLDGLQNQPTTFTTT